MTNNLTKEQKEKVDKANNIVLIVLVFLCY